jgi:hypothetical protein
MYAFMRDGGREVDNHHLPIALHEVSAVEQIPVHDILRVQCIRGGHYLPS